MSSPVNRDLKLALRRARSKRRISIRSAAKRLKSTVRKIRELERDPVHVPVATLSKAIDLYQVDIETVFQLQTISLKAKR